MSIHHKNSSSSQSSSIQENKLFVSQHFKICKAKLYKRKYIQKQNKQELGLYKQKMLRLVKKRSSQSLQQAEKRIIDLDQQFKLNQSEQKMNILLQQFEYKIREWQGRQEREAVQLVSQCKRIISLIELQNNLDMNLVTKAADRIQEICLDAIIKDQGQRYKKRVIMEQVKQN